MDYERGLFISGPRLNWIAMDPDAAQPGEVIAHEYLHAVLNQRHRNLPRWIEEGICDYYASLRYVTSKAKSTLEIGAPPGSRLALLRRSVPWNVQRLADKEFPPEAYAWAWAHIHLALRNASLATLLENPETHRWTQARGDEEYVATVRSVTAIPLSPIVRLAATQAEELRALATTAFEDSPPENSGESSFLAGLRLLDDGRPADARPLLETAVRLGPSQSSWWLTLASAYAELKLNSLQREATTKAINTAVTDTEKSAAEAALRALQ